MEVLLVNVVLGLVAVLLTYSIWAVHHHYFTKPRSILKRLRAQGVKGFPFVPFVGQMAEGLKLRKKRETNSAFAAATHGAEFFIQAHEKYGSLCTSCLGPHVRLSIADPAMLRQAYVNLNDFFVKSHFIRALKLLGLGLLNANGELWAWQRRLINPAFNHKEVKRMFHTMALCSDVALARLAAQVQTHPGQTINLDQVFNRLALDIICRAGFGAHIDTLLGPEVLESIGSAFREYLSSVVKSLQLSGVVPPLKYLPLQVNRKVWASEKLIRETIDKIIAVRQEKHRQKMEGKKAISGQVKRGEVDEITDLLELMMGATEGREGEGHSGSAPNLKSASAERGAEKVSKKLTIDLLKANCITFLFAGHETTANLLTWTSLLLSQHPEWQERAREEVNAVFDANGGRTPSFEQLSELKMVGCILNESLRLYPPAPVMGRTCIKDTKVGDITVPQDCDILIPIAYIHRNKELWGDDAGEFRPERFANGTSKAASHPNAFIPFSLGPRTCIGQNFAFAEGKIILAMFLRKFSWAVSPSYRHHPEYAVTLRAKWGMPMNLTLLE